MKDWLSIGEFGKQTGLSAKALRLYEEKGILLPHVRSESQYRYYSQLQLEIAKKIQHYKELGFSLEQIKTILQQTNEKTLKEFLETRLKESSAELVSVTKQVESLKSILASLNKGDELTEEQRGEVMSNLLETSIDQLKRRGVVPDEKTRGQLSKEVAELSPELKKVLSEMPKILQFAKDHHIFLGPGRGSSGASLILFGEGYLPWNPLKFGLMPELFGMAKQLWIDVEFSHHQEIGALCDEMSKKTNFEIVAFRCPTLDIFQSIQKEIGIIHFDEFRDDDPMLFEAPKRLGIRGLWDLEWSNDFDAFRILSEEEKKTYDIDGGAYENWILRNRIRDVEDFLNISVIAYFRGLPVLDDYRRAKADKDLPELNSTNGFLIYREDWLRIFMRSTSCDLVQAMQVFKAYSKKNVNDEELWMQKIQSEKIKQLLIQEAPKVFLKSHIVRSWWYYKRTAILKSLWTDLYLRTIDEWEQKHGMIWQEFGYKRPDGSFHLKA